MQDYFESEILRTEQELTDLKTSQQKFAGEVPLVIKSINVSIGLSLDSSQTTARGEQKFKITMSKPSMFVPTLAHYYDDVSKSEDSPRTTRYMYFMAGKIGDNQYLVRVIAYGTEWSAGSDVETIKGGGSVTLTNTLTVQSTDDFTLEAL